MPRTADHDARRAQICRGVHHSALQVGLASVTVAHAARAAGVSVGLVQHYYPSKEDLLVDTLDRVLTDVLARVEQATTLAEQRHARIEHMLGAGIEQLLPLDQTRREEAYLRMAFAGLSLDQEALRPHQQRFTQTLVDRAARAIENAFTCGEIPDPDEVDPQLEAYALLSMADGLCGHLLIGATASETHRTRAVVASCMSRLFPGTCAHRE
ncbi:MAG: TetR/AcrR family transcriptional regulator [Tessaracoccus sp.]